MNKAFNQLKFELKQRKNLKLQQKTKAKIFWHYSPYYYDITGYFNLAKATLKCTIHATV